MERQLFLYQIILLGERAIHMALVRYVSRSRPGHRFMSTACSTGLCRTGMNSQKPLCLQPLWTLLKQDWTGKYKVPTCIWHTFPHLRKNLLVLTNYYKDKYIVSSRGALASLHSQNDVRLWHQEHRLLEGQR